MVARGGLVRIGAYAGDIVLLPQFKALAPWLPAGAWLLAALALVGGLLGAGSRVRLAAAGRRA